MNRKQIIKEYRADSFLDLCPDSWKFSLFLLFISHVYPNPPSLVACLQNLPIPQSLISCCQTSSSMDYQIPHVCHTPSRISCERSYPDMGLGSLLCIRFGEWLWTCYWPWTFNFSFFIWKKLLYLLHRVVMKIKKNMYGAEAILLCLIAQMCILGKNNF